MARSTSSWNPLARRVLRPGRSSALPKAASAASSVPSMRSKAEPDSRFRSSRSSAERRPADGELHVGGYGLVAEGPEVLTGDLRSVALLVR